MKKIISIFIALLIMSILPINFVYAENDVKICDSQAYTEFLSSLKITEELSLGCSDNVSRGQFIHMIIRAMNEKPMDIGTEIFTDVTKETPYSASIWAAANMGIIAGDGAGVFEPDSPISFDAAVKITVAALGYTNMARAKGDYPIGYLSIAKDIDLTAGLGNSGMLTFDECKIFIYNFLNADLCTTTGVINGLVDQERAYGHNLLTDKFNLKMVEGIVKTAGYESMVPGESISKSSMKVGALSLKCDIENAEKYLGKKARVWYDEQMNAKAIFVNRINSEIKINAKDLGGFENGTLKVYDAKVNKDYDYKVDTAYTFVKNGRFYIPKKEDFTYKAGSMTLIDNNGDGIYDVVKANVAEYMVVSGVNIYDEIIYDIKGETSLNAKMHGNYFCKLMLQNENGEIRNITLDDIKNDQVLMVYRSADEKYCKAIAFEKIVKGKVEEKLSASADKKIPQKFMLSGAEYETNAYYNTNYSLEIGMEGNFLLAADGSITAFNLKNSDMSYGYLVEFWQDDSLDKKIQVGILTTRNKIIYPELSNNVIVDGKRTEKSALTSKLQVKDANGEDIPNYQLLKYSQGEDGKINKLDFAENAPEGDEKYDINFYGDNSLTKFLSGQTADWWYNASMFAPYGFYGQASAAFGVPFSAGDAPKRYDVEDFGCFAPTSLGNYFTGLTIDAYDIDKNLNIGAVIRYGYSNANVDQNTALAIVESISTAINSAGDEGKMLTYYKDKKFVKSFIPSDVYDSLKIAGNVPGGGDVVRIVTDAEGNVSNLALDIDFNEINKTIIIGASAGNSNIATNRFANLSYSTGKVLTHTPSSIILKVDAKVSGEGRTLDNGKLPYGISGTLSVAVYDTKNSIIKHGGLEMILDGYVVGEENASNVVLRTYDGRATHIYIYQ